MTAETTHKEPKPHIELLFDILLDTGAKYQASGADSLNLKINEFCVIKKGACWDYGQIRSVIGPMNPALINDEFPQVKRKATVNDQSKANENLMSAKSAFRTAQSFVEKSKLPMKLLNAHYTFDRKLITFQFTADGRVDFRNLVKDLSQTLNTRIELRQIGVRDETSILGGIGVCGQPLCCKRFLRQFESINVKMAKEQDLSLNPTNISGVCGRLKCCLKYEHEGYLELDKNMPRRSAMCECSDGIGRIVDRNLLTQKVTVQIEESGKYITVPKEEVRVVYPDKYKIKNGSALPIEAHQADHQTEEIPTDLAALEDGNDSVAHVHVETPEPLHSGRPQDSQSGRRQDQRQQGQQQPQQQNRQDRNERQDRGGRGGRRR